MASMDEILKSIKDNIISNCISQIKRRNIEVSFLVQRETSGEQDESSYISIDELETLMRTDNIESLFLYGMDKAVHVFAEIHTKDGEVFQFPTLGMRCNILFFYDIPKSIIEGLQGFSTNYRIHPSDIYSWGFLSDNLSELYDGIKRPSIQVGDRYAFYDVYVGRIVDVKSNWEVDAIINGEPKQGSIVQGYLLYDYSIGSATYTHGLPKQPDYIK